MNICCDCGGREFGYHRNECPIKNGIYAMRFKRRPGVHWSFVFVVLGTVLFARLLIEVSP